MKVKQIDTYITSTRDLLKANPSGTTISITYTHSKSNKDKPKTIIKFKTNDPRCGICYSYKTHKIKEFSKLFNALGPNGCNVQGEEQEGLSLILSNVDKKDVIEETTTQLQESTTEPAPAKVPETTQRKKNKKKKGKK